MEYIKCDEVIVPDNRIRREFDEAELVELANSILSKGLLHSIVVRNDGRTLVSGERRLRTFKHLYKENSQLVYPLTKFDGIDIPHGTIPASRLSELGAIQLIEAELEENILRTDLTWQEHAWAVSRLHALRQMQTSGKQTLTDTAREITGETLDTRGRQVANISDALLVSGHLDDLEIAAAPTLKEAKKLLSAKMDKLFRQALIDQHGFQADRSIHTIYQGHYTSALQVIVDTFDCVVTDPPYGIGADSFGSQATTKHDYNDAAGTIDYASLIAQLAAVAKQQCHIYMFCDPSRFFELRDMFIAQGISVWPTPLIWHKANGMLPEPDFGPRRCYETILFANKGQKRVTGVYRDVLTYPPVAMKTHAAEKPLDVYCDLLRRSCIPGDHVLDPFCGSGVIFPAASKLQLIATGIELSKDAYNLAAMRLNSAI